MQVRKGGSAPAEFECKALVNYLSPNRKTPSNARALDGERKKHSAEAASGVQIDNSIPLYTQPLYGLRGGGAGNTGDWLGWPEFESGLPSGTGWIIVVARRSPPMKSCR